MSAAPSIPNHLDLSDPDWQALTLITSGTTVDIGALRLHRANSSETQKLTPKAMQVLVALAQRPQQTIARDQIIDWVWKYTYPTPDVLTQAIKELRKALNDDQKAPAYIETIPKLGYRWIAASQFQSKSIQGAVADPTAQKNGSNFSADIAEETSSDILKASSMQEAAIHHPVSQRRWIVLTILVLGALFWLGLRLFSEQVEAPSSAPSELESSFRLLTSDPGIERNPNISRNGKTLAYVKPDDRQRARIWVRDLASPKATTLNPDQSFNLETDELNPQLSADGQEVLYLRFQGPAHLAPVTGSPYLGGGACYFVRQRVLAGVPQQRQPCPLGMVLPFRWSAEEEILLPMQTKSSTQSAQESVGIYSLNIRTGQRQRLASTPEQAVFDGFPMRSPDGRWLAFRRGGNVDAVLMLADADGRSARPLRRLGFSARGMDWLPDSSGLIASVSDDTDHELVRIDLQGGMERLQVPGQFPSIANSGQIVMTRIEEEVGLFEFDLRSQSPGRRILASTSVDSIPSLSPDGSVLVFQSRRGGINQLWIASMHDVHEQGSARPITQQPGQFSNVHWRPNGRSFWYAMHQSEPPHSQIFEFDLATEVARAVPGIDTLDATSPQASGMIIRISVVGDVLFILASQQGRRTLWRAAPQQRPERLMDDVGSFQIDASSGRLFLTRVGNNTLFERLSNGELRVIIKPFEPQFIWHWRAHGERIYFHQNQSAGMTLMAFDTREPSLSPVRTLPNADLGLNLVQMRAVVPQAVRIELNIATVTWPSIGRGNRTP